VVSLLAQSVALCLAVAAGEPRPLKDLIADLDAPDYKVREAASDELLAGKPFSLDQLERALKDPSLTAEQRLRLDRAGLTLFKNAPHGAMGVRFGGGADAVEIASVEREFPASTVLKAGDIITHMDGEPVTLSVNPDRRTASVRAVVISHAPGDEVPVVVQRGGEAVRVTVRLGDFSRLNGNVGPGVQSAPYVDDAEFAAAWRQRLRRTTGTGVPEPIDATSLRPRREAQWGSPEASDVVDAANRARASTGEVPSVIAGAAPEPDRQAERAESIGVQQGFSRFNGARNAAVRLGVPNDQREMGRMSDAELEADRKRLVQWRISVLQIVDQPGLSRTDRQQVRLMDDGILQQLAQIEREQDRRKAARQDAKPAPAPAKPEAIPATPDDAKPDQKPGKP